MQQIVPLDNSPNQVFSVTLTVDGKPLLLNCILRYNEIAKYWVLTIFDKNNSLLLDSIPLVTGNNPACNILGQFTYLNIGALYVINQSGTTLRNYPDNTDLGADFVLIWGDTP